MATQGKYGRETVEDIKMLCDTLAIAVSIQDGLFEKSLITLESYRVLAADQRKRVEQCIHLYKASMRRYDVVRETFDNHVVVVV